MNRTQSCATVVMLACAIVGLGALPASAEIWVVCDRSVGDVLLEEQIDQSRHIVIEGPLPGRRTATVWVEENCPEWRCSERGACGERIDTRGPSGDPTANPALTDGSWIVVCEPSSGGVALAQAPPPPGTLLLPGGDGSARQHGDWETARRWAAQQCPSWRCDESGRCAAAGLVPEPASGWVVGELTSKRLGGPSPAAEPAPAAVATPLPPAGAPGGPPVADLSPLVNATTAAASGCGYPAALASVEQIALFDPHHPFYAANRDKIWSLAERQRQTEETVWLASAALQAGNWDRARDLARAAADVAVSCQTAAVSGLLGGIDTAIKQIQEQNALQRQQAAARLLPGLVSLSNALIGAESGVPVDVEGLMAEIAPSVGLDLPLGALDPCGFKYDYPEAGSVEPSCSCAGYRFDPGLFRCVK